LQNRQGKTRLSKWYITPPDDNERVKMEADINRVISLRSKGHTNFVEVSCMISRFFFPFAFVSFSFFHPRSIKTVN
jgi:hypothetical protein